MQTPPSTLLLIEDDPNDQVFITRALRRCGVAHRVVTVTNGLEAICYLTNAAPYADRAANPFPALIITDLKMPLMGGLELLRWLDANLVSRVVPTLVLTSSTSQSDVAEAFKWGANAFLVKPVAYEQLQIMMKTVLDYWRLSLIPAAAGERWRQPDSAATVESPAHVVVP